MHGKDVKLKRILENGKTVIVPMDHGASNGPIAGIEEIDSAVSKVSNATAIILHKGMIQKIAVPRCGVIMHLSASTSLSPEPNRKVLVGSVREALALGCDGVSVHVNLGSEFEAEMLSSLGEVSAECEELQMPLLAMMYVRGKNVASFDPDAIALSARVAAELGADIVKCPFTGDVETFKKVVRGCGVPVVVAGGPKMGSDLEVLKLAEDAIRSGAAGTSIGRNVFQHANPTAMVEALRAVVIGRKRAEEAISLLSNSATQETLNATALSQRR